MGPTYITLEQAILLKEKGFNEKCGNYYVLDYSSFKSTGIVKPFVGVEDGGIYLRTISKSQPHMGLAPEQHQVIEWLLDTHGIWVYSYPVSPFNLDGDDYPKVVWVSKVVSLKQVNFEKFVNSDNGLAINHHHSPQEAISAAIDYILKEII